ncbi:unnamed protein product [Brassicogethes aeneus]|uniref:ITPR-interacting domain-containing protein n=1 Tax=Brassicogethes aeneus TaxID=1431903 RepID=A0A9P0B8G4_BRAAE|nr:unnamed protein product [Brassicogethes aeneus]
MDRQTTVQQWINTLPSNNSTVPTNPLYRTQSSQKARKLLSRDLSLQSDDASSYCSSVESVLEQRRPDPEAVLLGLGFGPQKNSTILSRIPPRFLQPSKLFSQQEVNKFLEQYETLQITKREVPQRYHSLNEKSAPT